jgi:16S rRNA (uracil1498-N3)-methyltransferase
MNPPRVYHPEHLQVGRDVRLSEAASHHLGRVLRVSPGDPVVVFNGQGGEYRGSVRSVERTAVRVRCDAFDSVERESNLQLGLAQIVSAGEKMDFCVQKAVELGVAWIQPLTGRRGKVRLEAERAERRVAHWQRIAIAACEQCGRNRIPAVRPLLGLFSWLGQGFGPAQRLLLLDPGANRALSALDRPGGEVTLLAGGESGFAPEEVEAATASGFLPLSLGPRTLRTETAGLAALAAMQALWGDL